MKFEWDESKNELNIARHGIDFRDIYEIFNYPMMVEIDIRKDYGEIRYVAVGQLQGQAVVIVYVMRGNVIRIISVRRANRHERKNYATYVREQNELEEITSTG